MELKELSLQEKIGQMILLGIDGNKITKTTRELIEIYKIGGFILYSKNISIVSFELKTIDENIIKIKAYNEMADKCYSQLTKGNIVCIQGQIDSKMEIIISEINILNWIKTE